jgi:hypothetical protein
LQHADRASNTGCLCGTAALLQCDQLSRRTVVC